MDVYYPKRARLEIAMRGEYRKDTRVATASPEAGTLQAAPLVSLAGTADRAGAFLLNEAYHTASRE
jgi:hypothetical protein